MFECKADVIVYGASSGGCLAAVAARQEGASVILVEPTRSLGGMLTAGIKPGQDCPDPTAVGGLTSSVVLGLGDTPPELRERLTAWVSDAGVEIITEHRISSATVTGGRITTITVEHAAPNADGSPVETGIPAGRISGTVFIDASYDGDLMAEAGVDFRTGREARDVYGEEPAGVQPVTNWTPIEPWPISGDPSSGLLSHIEADHGLPVGAGDDNTQGTNFRYYVTNDPDRRIDLTAPDGYDPGDYELLGRYVKHVVATEPEDRVHGVLGRIFPGWLNRGDYNYWRSNLFSQAPLGLGKTYQDGTPTEKAQVWRDHMNYLRGIHTFLSTDERVPADFRRTTAELGLDRTIYPDTQGWPHLLYVRTTRRMVGDYTLTHRDVLNQTRPSDSVGLALYGVDTYPVRRIPWVQEGVQGVATEGNMFIGGARGTGTPFQVPYRSLVPASEQVSNLIVPTCVSASYIAYAALRMEPVFCVLGESAAVAATMAIDTDRTVQSIDTAALQRRLRSRGQLLEP